MLEAWLENWHELLLEVQFIWMGMQFLGETAGT